MQLSPKIEHDRNEGLKLAPIKLGVVLLVKWIIMAPRIISVTVKTTAIRLKAANGDTLNAVTLLSLFSIECWTNTQSLFLVKMIEEVPASHNNILIITSNMLFLSLRPGGTWLGCVAVIVLTQILLDSLVTILIKF